MSETTSLLFEIGCEEIPARFLEMAEHDLGERLASALATSRLLHQSVLTGPLAHLPGRALKASRMQTYSTPRRLVVYIPALYAQQPSLVNEVVGPPVKVAFDKEGMPTRAAESFAVKYNVKVSDLRRVTNPKGEYLVVEHREAGRSALEVLVEALPAVLGSMTFPKSMYWTAKSGPLFIRPIRWILALLGEGSNARVVPFEFAGVKSGECTFGHRLKGSKPISVTGFDDYVKKLREHMVEPDPKVRRERTQNEIKVLLEVSPSRPVADMWLEDWVVNSTEWPVPLMGGFDPRYLALPREVLVTVMRDHQKYFAVEDEAGNLMPRFITVLNVEGDPKGLIRQGHERVLAARFADAEFFWNADQKITLAERIPMLERVTYQAKLGTYADKVKRMKALAENICAELESSGRMTVQQRNYTLRAIELCKCDLTTQMVQEFTELQGIMGGLYANKAQGEPAEVAEAIYDHYKPVGIEDTCPRSIVGAVVSLADKLDSVISGFAVGLEPTGSSDPFGLRRAGNGVVKITAEKLPTISLDRLLDFRFLAIPNSFYVVSRTDLRGSIMEFLRERVEYFLRDVAKLRYDTTRAIIGSVLGWDKPSDAMLRGLALEQIRDSEDYKSLSQATKRTRNILIKSEHIKYAPGKNKIRADLFEHHEEHELYEAFESMRTRLLDLEKGQEYEQAFRELARMRKPVDEFFNRVHVMTGQLDAQNNRLRLLNSINWLVFSRLANLAAIEPGGSNG